MTVSNQPPARVQPRLRGILVPLLTPLRPDESVDLPSLGYYDVRDEGAVVMEWADKVDEKLLGDHVRIEFSLTGEASRRLMLHARGERSAKFLQALNLFP